MASSPTSRLRLMKQATYDNPDSWGNELNGGGLDMADEAWARAAITVGSDVSLDAQNYITDEARRFILHASGAGGFTITTPAVDKPYWVINDCAANITVKPAGGTGAVIRAGTSAMWYTDGSTGYVSDPTLDKIKLPEADVSLNGQKLVDVADPVADTDAATKGYVDTRTLSTIGAPTADVSWDGHKITQLGAPVDPTDAATKGYIDTLASSGNLATVAGIAAQITAVAAVDDEVVTVAGISADVQTVSTNDANVTLVGENIDAIINASQLLDGLTSVGLVRDARTSSAQLVKADRAKLIDITSGTFTQTFATAAALEANWWCYIQNSGTGDITLDPAGAETIDGLVSFVMYPGEVRLIQCDGAALRSIVIQSFTKAFTSSDTFIKPSGYAYFEGEIWGGGGSGAKAPGGGNAAGGGGGACVPFKVQTSDIDASESVTIASGGAGPSTAGATGADGGNSIFGPITAYGGSWGSATNQNTAASGGGGGGSESAGSAKNGGKPTVQASGTAYASNAFGGGDGGPTNVSGSSSSVYGGAAGQAVNASNTPITPGSSLYGGAGGGGVGVSGTGAGGTSTFGGDGGAAGDAISGTDGQAPGGGGGGTRTGTKAGDGARGELRIRGIA